ncbi:nitroreductase/quinone reductase family protein [Herbiconiux sp. KACC 21604]|uniref:nitroreductase/quinone reductase family protein n=1 Tax=unclassified Herbiconiux TaxID=2618217 RepID=UPI0014926FD0|nr:nitroreductase/quinone reductase family protein [Herbiconiux sp. SALV-R1]QJU52614.1 nitroreductase family deazaflavin-dependent oxidoreductase [Herbiconiux sp. SALV-R1]WPO87505.1 nitroreductase/quinone reductase family protein [Herbiconiux sp. KACC 21604]
MSDFNERIVEEFRANGGTVSTAGFGDKLVLLHTTGAKSGAARISPVMGFPEQDGWLVVASKAGAPENPAWYANLVAHPDAAIETPGENGVETVEVTARALSGDEYAAAWKRVVAAAPGFDDYRIKARHRTIPVLLLTRRG